MIVTYIYDLVHGRSLLCVRSKYKWVIGLSDQRKTSYTNSDFSTTRGVGQLNSVTSCLLKQRHPCLCFTCSELNKYIDCPTNQL